MALIYLFLRVIAFALLKKATWKHNRAKSRLELADEAYRKTEALCKAQEVESGRAAEFPAQFKMMKLFEIRDTANDRWKFSANRMGRRQKFADWLKSLNGRFIPYAFGMGDMVLGATGYHWVLENPELVEQVTDFVARI